ncbi:MAG: LysR family transcriptional regulator [Sneathiella sp.]|nr:LysR family transcriptional regulator [Sneathiella sp.]
MLPNVSLRELQILRETIELQSATRAARRMGISQPAVSRALSRLEERLELTLFDRTDRKLIPTQAAYALNEELSPVFTSLENVAQFSQNTHVSQTETLRVVTPTTFSIHLVMPLISEFIKEHPQARFEIDISSSPECIRKVASGEADIGITNTHLSHEGIKFMSFQVCDAVCVMPKDHPLGAKREVTAKDLADYNIIAIAKSMSSRHSFDRALERAGVEPNIIAEVTASYTACQLISQNLGIGVINPFPTLIGDFDNLIARPFSPVHRYDNRIITSTHRSHGWLAQKFISSLIATTQRQWDDCAQKYNLPTIPKDG